MAGAHLRIATWNVHGCVGRDRRHDLQRTAAIVRGFDADLAALQEIDSRRGAAHEDAFTHIAGAVGPHAVGARTVRAPGGDYGHLLAARVPLQAYFVHDVSVPRREPRQIIECRVPLPDGGALAVLAVHLDLNARARHAQLRALRVLVESAGHLPVLALGDFNGPRRGIAEHLLRDVLWPVPSPATWPARWPVFALDRIWCRPSGLVAPARIPALDRRASDHLPLIAELDLAAAAEVARAAAPAAPGLARTPPVPRQPAAVRRAR